MNQVAIAVGRLATLYAHGAPDPEAADAARRELYAAKLERAVREALAAAPPLTTEQRQRIARLLSEGVA